MVKPAKENEAYYDEFADWYENERHSGYHAFIDRLETDLILPYVSGKDVLEIGCGTGLILRRVEPIAKRAVGMDLSEGMLEKARERGLEVYKANATDLPFEDDSFDVVYSFKVLAHVEDINKALQEMSRVTRPGGVLLLEFYNKMSLRYLAKKIGGPQKISAQTHEGAVYTRWDTPFDLSRRLPEGLKIKDWAGVRVVTPLAKVHSIPGVRGAFQHVEMKARDSMLKYFGGFLVVILEKELG